MSDVPVRSRLHLIAAPRASKIVVIQRKRAKLFHILTIDTRTHEITQGSWFHGKIFALRSDVSFDGQHMVYLALGADGDAWNGVCRLPWLKTILEGRNTGTWHGGGYFATANLLRINGWHTTALPAGAQTPPFEIERFETSSGAGDIGLLYCRLERDGFRRLGPSWGKGQRVPSRTSYTMEWIGDDGWARQFSPRHPELRMRYLGYFDNRETFAFSLTGHEGLLDDASWATWDAEGALWATRPGVVEQYRLRELKSGRPSFTLDVDQFEPPHAATQ